VAQGPVRADARCKLAGEFGLALGVDEIAAAAGAGSEQSIFTNCENSAANKYLAYPR
jgi:hypothetical protein